MTAHEPNVRVARTRWTAVVAAVGLVFALSCALIDDRRQATPGGQRRLPGRLNLVGQTSLYARGMNAGLAVWNGYAYVGSRTDGSPGHRHPGVLVVDVSDPTGPRVVGEIDRPNEGNHGETSRELRIWQKKGLLIVLNFACDETIHDCAPREVHATVRFYDIVGRYAASPRLVATYRPSRDPHEFFFWRDPNHPKRALLYMSTPMPGDQQLLVTDISAARKGRFEEIATWGTTFPDPGPDDTLHSVSVSQDGRTAYLAYLTAGFLMLDTGAIADGADSPAIESLTSLTSRPQWPGPGVHSAVPIPDRQLVLTTDEVYGGSAGGGCPWGWIRLIDVTLPSRPAMLSEYRADPYNREDYCNDVAYDRSMLASFSSHNPTVTSNLALVSWHSAGLQLISIEDSEQPIQTAQFIPKPRRTVKTEDPLLSAGQDKVVVWSYPIVADGLIYVVDVRNGLYILEYDGPHQSEIDNVVFLEGNSNLDGSDNRTERDHAR